MTVRTSRRLTGSPVLGAVIAIAVAAFATAGCGGGDGTTDAGGASPPTAGTQDRQLLQFARCMREHGIDFPDPQRDANGQLVFNAPAGGDPAALQDAQKACQKFIKGGFAGGPSDGPSAGGAPSPAQIQKERDAGVKFARCMRRNGAPKFPDPQIQGGQILIDPGPDFDPNDPAGKRAVAKCRGLLDPGGTAAP
jgi:hypothetical protein